MAQLILRLALGVGFLMPVMDRIGLLGPYGSGGATWGDWKHFVDYTNTLVPFASRPIANIMGLLATIAEVVFGVCLIISFRIKKPLWAFRSLMKIRKPSSLNTFEGEIIK
jgi:uncharacterized membrane protein YphA (DoxX/SURF4 family)